MAPTATWAAGGAPSDPIDRIVVLNVRATGPVASEQVEGLSALVATAVQGRGGLQVVTGADIVETLGFEAQRQLMGCEEDAACVVEIAGSLDARYLLASEVSRFGSRWLLTLTLLEARTGGAIERTTVTAGSEDELVEGLAGAVVSLLAGLPGGPIDAVASPGPASTRRVPVTFDVGGGTDVPLQLGIRFAAEGPGRARLATAIGMMPGPYVDLTNAAIVALGGYDEATAELVRSALARALVLRLHAGWRPFHGLGLYVEAGYGLVALGGSAATAQVVAVALGRELPEDVEHRQTFSVRSTLHLASVEVGWAFPVAHGFVARVGLGGAFTFASGTSITPDFTPTRPVIREAVARLATDAEAYLDATYRSYGHSPVVTVGVGYTF